MTNGFKWMTGAIAASTLALTACGGGAAEAAGGAPASGGEPAIVITDAAEWEALSTSGKVSFDRACGTCHPGGEADLGPAINKEALTMASMTTQIREGSGRMRPIDASKLPDEEMRGIMVYMATLGAVSDVKGP